MGNLFFVGTATAYKTRKLMGWAHFTGLLFIVIGCIFAGIYLAMGGWQYLFCTQEVSAVVVDVEEDFSYVGGGLQYAPIVEYTVDGTSYSATLDFSQEELKVGAEISVFYNPSAPEKIALPENASTARILTGICAFTVIVGVVLIVVRPS